MPPNPYMTLRHRTGKVALALIWRQAVTVISYTPRDYRPANTCGDVVLAPQKTNTHTLRENVRRSTIWLPSQHSRRRPPRLGPSQPKQPRMVAVTSERFGGAGVFAAHAPIIEDTRPWKVEHAWIGRIRICVVHN